MMNSTASTHTQYMQQALQLAAQGRFTVSPNPMVGCVIVKNDRIVGEGFHHHAGGPHAEVLALAKAQALAKDATAYVTLEPCNHFGRTPPCTEALIEAGIRTVYIACTDPNPQVTGCGMQRLQEAGIEVHHGLCEQAAQSLNEFFFHYMRYQQPFVIAKWAMSFDGEIMTHPEDSRIITGQAAQVACHELRAEVDAILVGANTVCQDDPLLTVRSVDVPPEHNPLRIIVTTRGNLPLSLNVFNPDLPGKTLVATTTLADTAWLKALDQHHIEYLCLPPNDDNEVDLSALLQALGKRSITSVLVEGGKKIHQRFMRAKLINRVQVYLAPTLIGNMPCKQPLKDVKLTALDHDFLFTAKLC